MPSRPIHGTKTPEQNCSDSTDPRDDTNRNTVDFAAEVNLVPYQMFRSMSEEPALAYRVFEVQGSAQLNYSPSPNAVTWDRQPSHSFVPKVSPTRPNRCQPVMDAPN